jgi:hypothetical protein
MSESKKKLKHLLLVNKVVVNLRVIKLSLFKSSVFAGELALPEFLYLATAVRLSHSIQVVTDLELETRTVLSITIYLFFIKCFGWQRRIA